MAEALANGADVVILGRCAESAPALGPLMKEFGWRPGRWDLLAAGTLVTTQAYDGFRDSTPGLSIEGRKTWLGETATVGAAAAFAAGAGSWATGAGAAWTGVPTCAEGGAAGVGADGAGVADATRVWAANEAVA